MRLESGLDVVLSEGNEPVVLLSALGGEVWIGCHPVNVEDVLEERSIQHRRLDPAANPAGGKDSFEGVRSASDLSRQQDRGTL